MIYFKKYCKSTITDSGDLIFRRYLDGRFIDYIEGKITHLFAEDFGDMTEMQDNVVAHLDNLEYIELSDSITHLGDTSIYDVPNLRLIIFPSNLQTLGYNLFIAEDETCSFIADFSKAKQVPVPSGNNGFELTYLSGFNYASTIKVPAALYEEWVSSSFWNHENLTPKFVAV